MSFLDPYEKNRRLPLLVVARVLLLAVAAALGWLVWSFFAG